MLQIKVNIAEFVFYRCAIIALYTYYIGILYTYYIHYYSFKITQNVSYHLSAGNFVFKVNFTRTLSRIISKSDVQPSRR